MVTSKSFPAKAHPKLNTWFCVVTGKKYTAGDYVVQSGTDFYIVNSTIDLTGERQAEIEQGLGIVRKVAETDGSATSVLDNSDPTS